MEQRKDEFADITAPVDFNNIEQMSLDCWMFLTHDGLPNEAKISREAFRHEVSAMIESCRQSYAKKQTEDIVNVYDEYAKLLSEEIEELIGLANVHLWKSSRVDKGKELREKIAKLKQPA